MFKNNIMVFENGEKGYNSYRIPTIAKLKDGTLLAIAEGRLEDRSDFGENHLVIKKSKDNGESWTNFKTIFKDGKRTLSNACPIVACDGTVHLIFSKCDGTGGHKLDRRELWYTRSTDDGENWTNPKNITESIKTPDTKYIAGGPCHGLELSSGRLAIPSYLKENNGKRYGFIIYSDDSGSTWQRGGFTENCGINEVVLVELENGDLYLNGRDQGNESKRRIVTVSKDKGETWCPVKLDDSLIDPKCQGSAIRYDFSRILFVNCACTTIQKPLVAFRKDLTVRVSYDSVCTWKVSKIVKPGSSGYSDIVVCDDGTIGVFYEVYENDNFCLKFARFDLEWLEK